jgi:sugar-specific transcriptional regulator TrmB
MSFHKCSDLSRTYTKFLKIVQNNKQRGKRLSKINEEYIRTLENLGLSLLQSKIYLYLANLGTVDVKTIAKTSNIARQDIYRIIQSLEKLGLVERAIAKPTLYKPLPVKEALTLLLKKEKQKYVETKKDVERMAKNLNTDTQIPFPPEMQFILTTERTRLLKVLKKIADSAKSSLDGVAPLKMNCASFIENYPYFKNAANRGVRVRFILRQTNQELLRKYKKIESKNALIEFRYMPESVHLFGFNVFDDKEAILAMSEDEPMPSLWTNNLNVVHLVKSHFESIWAEAQKDAVLSLCPKNIEKILAIHKN